MSALLMVLAQAAASEPPIIVTARPQTEKALAACLARRCGVREDAVASIKHAQAQFADGLYPNARRTLMASLGRNRGQDKADPRAMSALWQALARVTLHNGDLQEFRRAALRSGSILARAESVTPSERVRGEVQIADALAMSGDPDGAVRRYRTVGDLARAGGDTELTEIMSLRALYARSTLDGRPAARRALERAAADTTLTARARTMAAGLAAQLQDTSRAAVAEALLDRVPVQSESEPVMVLRNPPTKLDQQREAINRAVANGDFVLFNMLQPRGSDARRYSWADIGFWVRPDGRVAEPQVLRGSKNLGWTRDVLKSVQGRRYAPFKAEAAAEGRYKIERVTMTYEHQVPPGSLIRRRSGLPSYRYEDLKIETAGAPT